MARRTVQIKLNLKKLEKLQSELEPRAQAILDKGALDIMRMARMYAPVLTGMLRNSIHVEAPSRWTRIVADGVTYGVLQEYGTVRFGAQPFMTPAFEMYRRSIKRAWRALFEV